MRTGRDLCHPLALRVSAKPAVSNDQKTKYISGSVAPSQMNEQEEESANLPF